MNQLSIRSYSSQTRSHYHDYHQLILPLHGAIDIKIGTYTGKASLGDCVIVFAGQRHDFRAHESARFIVADMLKLPTNLMCCNATVFSVSSPLIAFIQYVEKQLGYQVNSEIESLSFSVFQHLLAQESMMRKLDPRIERVVNLIKQDLSQKYSIDDLSEASCLSRTQFKKVFTINVGTSPQKYMTQLRMEKACALLSHTDLPVRMVAESVGYDDLSAFSRRFSQYFGQSPKAFSR